VRIIFIYGEQGALLLDTDKLGERLDMPGVLQEDAEEGRVALKILRSQNLELHELLGTGAMVLARRCAHKLLLIAEFFRLMCTEAHGVAHT
jgi:hypothetical protein